MRLLAIALAGLCAAAAAQTPQGFPPPDKRRVLRAVLDYALWNGRINALYDVGELGRGGLDLLTYADDDADWQVRLTAVHFLGKLGSASVPALGDVARREPCPYVRLSALRYLSRMGPAGEPYYRSVLTPEDEEAMASLPARYGTERMGKPLVIDAPEGEMTPEFFNGGLDLRVCASSERSGRLRMHRDAAGGDAPDEVVKTADVPAKAAAAPAKTPDRPAAAPETPARKRRDAELDALLASGKPEILPPGPTVPSARAIASAAPAFESPGRRALAPSLVPGVLSDSPETLPSGPPGSEPGEAAAAVAPTFETADRRALARAAVRGVSSGTAETLPPGLPVPVHPETERGAADIVADAGAGKPENDPVPVLIEQLRSAQPRTRARAADELGKRGAAAAAAVPALRRALASDGDRRVRASAALALGSAGSPAKGVVAELRRALRDKDEDVRFSAGIALERVKRPH